MNGDDFPDLRYFPYPFYDGTRGLRVSPRVDEDLRRSDPPRTQRDYPYSYDPFTIWGKRGPSKECNGSVYTDRMEGWDYAKYRRLSQKHYRAGDTCWERPFDSQRCRGDLIQDFLRDWYEEPELKLLRVIEYCNWSTGYPTWRLDYYSPAGK